MVGWQGCRIWDRGPERWTKELVTKVVEKSGRGKKWYLKIMQNVINVLWQKIMYAKNIGVVSLR